MTIIACVDDSMGILFNNRRQSKDSIVIQEIINITEGYNLWMSNYSSQLFEKQKINRILSDNNFLSKAQENDFCFIENTDISNHKEKITKIILFKWNRKYPHDTILDINFNDFDLTELSELEGTSHKKITEEVWCKCR